MAILTSSEWEEYKLLDSGNGRRLEKYGKYTLDRPDPEVLWGPKLSYEEWTKADAFYERETTEKGSWNMNTPLAKKWELHYKNLSFWIKPTPFKHTGVFPEQALQWDWIISSISKTNRKVSLLNLFAYTGAASLAAASVGATVTHVDSSKPAVTWANENRILSKLPDDLIRWIVDDVVKFTTREIRRGRKYDAIILDPPVYGHGPKGEKWDFSLDIAQLLENCKQLLSDQPLFVLLNSYAVSHSALTLNNIMSDIFKDFAGTIDSGELTLKDESRKRLLSTGIYAHWKSNTI